MALRKLVIRYHQNEFCTPYENLKIDELKNGKGRLAHLGVNGKFYCGEKLEGYCSCCNGFCGPTNGENCLECMKLDLERRGLKKGLLVNARGNVCWKVGDLWQCGKLLD